MIWCLTGENDATRLKELQRRVAEFVSTYGEIAVERLEGDETSYERIHEASSSMPFLVERKLLVLRHPSQNKEFVDAFESWVTSVPDETDVLIIEPKLDKRSAYFKQLKKYTDFHDYTTLDANSLVRHVTHYATERGGAINASAARLLVDRAGLNQLQLEHEIDKLIAHSPHVTDTVVLQLTEASPQSSIFDLIRATFEGNGTHALKMYEEQRTLGVEPQQIIAMLAWQLHLLALAKAGGSRSADVIAKDAKVNPFTVSKSQGLARRLSVRQLQDSIRELRELDTRLKRESISVDEAVKYFIVSLAVQRG